jgi:hypothetical protein
MLVRNSTIPKVNKRGKEGEKRTPGSLVAMIGEEKRSGDRHHLAVL